MPDHSLYGMKELCYTEVSDFTGFQGIGKDPMYKRYDSVFSIIKKCIEPSLQTFLAHPIYSEDSDQIHWYLPNWNQTPKRLLELTDAEKDHYAAIKEETISKYKEAVMTLSGEDLQVMIGALKYINDEFIYCYDEKVSLIAWGMTPDSKNHKVIGSILHEFNYRKKFKITFDPVQHGNLTSKEDRILVLAEGTTLDSSIIPSIKPKTGYVFDGWQPNPEGMIINGELSFKATYKEDPNEKTTGPIIVPVEPVKHTCRFNSGENGTLTGSGLLIKEAGTSIASSEIPGVTPQKGYTFIGWDKTPTGTVVDRDLTFNAMYDKNVPWWKKLWAWLTSWRPKWGFKGCLSSLLRILLFLLLLWLLSFLFRGCRSCSSMPHTPVSGVGQREMPSGRMGDDNGSCRDILDSEGKLPSNNVNSPILNEDGTTPRIIDNPCAPRVISNRLNIYLEDDNADIQKWVSDFKSQYPDSRYSVIGYDDNVKMIQIQIPESERDQIRESLPNQLPNQKFFVVDESLFDLVEDISEQGVDPGLAGWHLRQTQAFDAWNITKGSSDVVIAVVDDGIDGSHKVFENRFVAPYNVFTQDTRLSYGSGHGTHVASLIAGSDKYSNNGISGIAPKCMIMPIQVFDNGFCTFSSVTSGIMYAIHHGADIVNVSLAPRFEGLNNMPNDFQSELANKYFKNEEKVWQKIVRVAKEKNVIIVFAAGNDNILAYVYPENRVKYSICVSAVEENYKSTTFTNHLFGADISAPGKHVYGALPDNSFGFLSGTSMSAPIVSGAIALMRSIKKDINVLQALHVMQNTGHYTDDRVPPMLLINAALKAVRESRYMDGDEQEYFPGGGIPNTQDNNATTTEDPVPSGDYDGIRELIQEYKQRISELERQLPENN